MRICMVSWHGCIRVYKEARALLDAGHEVDVVCQQAPFGYNKFTSVQIWFDREQLIREVASSPAQIFHVHNEPDWLVEATKLGAGKRPVIFDVHDLESLRSDGEPNDEEKKAFEAADGFIHVSEGCRKYAEQWHGNKKPSELIFSWVNREMVNAVPEEPGWWNVVYEGGMSGSAQSMDINGKNFDNFRYWAPIMEQFIEQGFNMTAFGIEEQGSTVYENLGVCIARELFYPVMLVGLRAHGFGLVGAWKSYPLMEAALPNKLFEYMSQGVVPLVINCAEAAKWVGYHDCGIAIFTMEDLAVQLSRGKECREKVLELRHEWVMENQVGKMVELYEKVLGN